MSRRPFVLAPLALSALVLAACTKPSLLVCRSVTEDGVCHSPPSEFLVGKPYVLYATGVGMPRGRVTIRLSRWEGARRVGVASAVVEVRDDATYFTNPLMFPEVGSYRISVLDASGDEFRHVDVRAPQDAVVRR